jgi:peptide chain release factor subunit 3
MSNLNSWEDDPSAQDENLSQQAQQQLNINAQNQRAGGFRPNVASFQPTAQTFQPGQGYGGYAPQYQQQQQQQYYQQGYYPQYGGQQQQGFNQYQQGQGQGQNYGGGFSQGYQQGYGRKCHLI